MRLTLPNLRSRTLSRVAILAVATAGLGACSSDTGRFGSDPVYTGSTPNQRSILGQTSGEVAPYGGYSYAGQPATRRAAERSWQSVDTTGSIGTPDASVYRRDLTPPTPPGRETYADTIAHPLAAATRPEPLPDTGATRVAAAGGWTGTGGSYVTLQPGETVDSLSRRYGVPVTAIQQANNYTPTANPQPGQRVLIPVYSAATPTPVAPQAPAVARPMAPQPQAHAPQAHVAPPARVAPPTVAATQVRPMAPAAAQAPRPLAPQAQAPAPKTVAPAPVRPVAPQAAATPRPAAPLTTGSVPKTAAPAVAPQAPAAPRAPAPQQAAAQPPRPEQGGVKLVGAYTVKQGDTLGSIARTYGVSEQALRERNNLRSSSVAPGQQILLPAGTKLMLKTSQAPAAPAPTAPVQVAEAKVPPAAQKLAAQPQTTGTTPKQAAPQPSKTEKVDQKAAETIAVAREPAPAAEDDKSPAAAGSFRWPVRGRVISEFGSKPNGERNEGINLAVPEGTSVKAADDGEVIYSGNELKGYGNLVLVRHSNGYVTAYAHASELLVNRGEKVGRGQIIARAGATGSVTQPQLHFELRKGQKAVDPKPFLASN